MHEIYIYLGIMFMPTYKHSHTPSHDIEDDEDEGTEHLVDELRTNAGAFEEEALVEKLLENLDLDEVEEDEHDAANASFFDSLHFSSIFVLQKREGENESF
ncbi:hypothetical protein AtNW77_Chr1g0007451 [Arabidopsis thaliana]|uniref:Uncharacterized protein At1g07490 n=2 Tax=Arabidopsis thaliana TaxID=3702 RepID=Q67XE6_ARATH|nr:uncharacterized protein AT1G07485 [Arabidopsis thaliana]AEE28134.1 hypothetical protein AT1G07485 [Arabidopsis thaliana]CAA0175601.1 unnamed protein product [Arabidopsis thaliana]CAD5312012.1 unnamed protein product [Arabidopsis thaliana]VYS45306.1 unnamed protein product [Arabidopsis thaliana]BAD44636.1 hypothetical protein [Arabidopsis thaliana]|eukprot:NP_001077475.1 hypothetical protein AT1G07485 [Arabidopsis thaliana]